MPGQGRVARIIGELEDEYFRAIGQRPLVVDWDHPRGILGRINPKNGRIVLYSGERFGPGARAEELLHYQQLKALDLLDKTEDEIGPEMIGDLEKEVENLLRKAGFRPKR